MIGESRDRREEVRRKGVGGKGADGHKHLLPTIFRVSEEVCGVPTWRTCRVWSE